MNIKVFLVAIIGIAISLGTKAQVNLSEGLVAYYPFNGNANDESGNGNDGIVQGNTVLTFDRFGNINSAFLFDGRSDDIVISDNSTLDLSSEMSISLWFNINSKNNTQWQALISKGVEPNENYAIFYNGNSNYIYHLSVLDGTRTAYPTPTDLVKLQEWFHVVVRFNGQRAETYLNGMLVEEEEWQGLLTTNDADLYIGSWNRGGLEFNGTLDDIRIYDRSINSEEIQQLYIDGISALTQPTNLSGKVLAHNKVELSWEDNNISEEGYELWRSIDSNDNYQLIATLPNNATTYTDSLLTESTSYFYKVRAISSIITNSIFSEESPITTLPKIALENGLVAYYPFNGNANDESGNENNGTNFGAELTRDKFGNLNSAYLFGGDDYIDFGDDSILELNSYGSLVASIKPNDPGRPGSFGGIVLNKEGEYEFARFADGRIRWAFDNEDPDWNWTTAASTELDQWTTIVITYESGYIKTFFDGQLVHEYSGKGIIGDDIPNANNLRVGGRQVGSQFFQGIIDDVRIYNRALNEDEVLAIYDNGGYQENDAALIGYNQNDGDHITEGTHPVQVILQNVGNSALTSATVSWKVNGVTQTPVSWNGSLNLLDTTYLTLGNVDFQPGIVYSIEGNISSTNDENSLNDVAIVSDILVIPAEPHYAIDFDGDEDYLVVSEQLEDFNVQNLTVEAWIKPEQLSNWSSVVIKSSRGWLDGFGLTHYTTENDIRFFVNSYSSINVRGFLKLDEWSHVAGTYDGEYLRMFINGLQVDSLAYTGAIDHSDTNLLIGNAPERRYHWEGGIDEVRIWNTARTSAQIKEYMVKNAKLKEESGLVATWHFGENISEKAFDIVSGKQAIFEGNPNWLLSEVPIGDNKSNNDAGILAINSPQNTGFEKGEKEVVVTLLNYGKQSLTVSNINWSVNGQLQPVFNWNGVLPPNQKDTLAIGTFNFEDGKPFALKAWTSSPNGLPDGFSFNDSTESVNIYTGLVGTYTIGGENPDFETLTEAVDILNNGGVSDAVIFNIRSGVYNEKVSITAFEGTDCNKKVIFQSETGNKEDVIIKSTSTQDANFILKNEGADGLILKNITFSSSQNNYGRIIWIEDGSECNEIFNCKLIGVTTNSENNNFALIYSPSNSQLNPDDRLLIKDSHFLNGSYGIWLEGPSSDQRENNIEVLSNNFIDQSKGAIFLRHLNGTKVIENTVKTSENSRANFIGFNLNDIIQAPEIARNILILKNASYGFYLNQVFGSDLKRGLISNNYISIAGTANTKGIYLRTTSSHLDYYHNTIHIKNINPNSSALFFYSEFLGQFTRNINLINNILTNTGGGWLLQTTGNRGIGSPFSSNYNNIFSTGINWIGYGTTHNSLESWQTDFNQDLNSFSTNPFFLSDTSYIITNPLLNNLGTYIPQVPFDIEGELRDTLNPDIGADEFDVSPNDVGITAFLSPVSDNCDLGDTVSISVELLNFSSQAQSGFEISYRIGNNIPVSESLPDSISLLPGERTVYTFQKKADFSTLGRYSILASLSVTGDQNARNDTLSIQVSNLGKVGDLENLLPMDATTSLEVPITFSWAPANLATTYDLYIWAISDTKPEVATVTDITSIRYTYRNTLNYGTTYNWQVIAKNKCSTSESDIQSFTVKDLPNLVVDVIQVQSTSLSGQTVPISWAVKNIGLGSTGNTQWIDALYLSNDPVLSIRGADRDIYIGGYPNQRALMPNDSYNNDINFVLPREAEGSRYVIVVTDRFNSVVESNEADNDIKFSEPPTEVQLKPPPDLQVENIIVPPTPVFSSKSYPIEWKVVNNGTNPTETDRWYDRIYLTTSEELNPNGAIVLGDILHRGVLEADSSYTATKEITLPQGIDGEYYIFVHSDFRNQVFEHFDEDNNIGRSDSLEVVLLPPPDLVVNEVLIPNEASSNQSIEVTWEVQNIGAGDTEVNSWSDAIYISEDSILSTNNATLLGSFSQFEILMKDSLYIQTATVRIPNNLKGGAYYLHVLTDRSNQVFEFDREGNNTAASVQTVLLQVPDLVVTEVVPPTAPSSGNPITISYRIKNNGPGNLLNANFIDRIYLTPTQDINHPEALLLGSLTNNSLTLLSDSSVFQSRTFTLPEGLEGSFYVGIQTDASERIFEDFMDFNNISYTTNTVNISISPSPDLQVTSLNHVLEKQAGDSFLVNYTIQNNGVGDVVGESWTDYLYLSSSPTWSSSSSRLLNRQRVSSVLPSGESYNQSIVVMLPSGLEPGAYYLFVQTDANNEIYEHAGANENNLLRGEEIAITAYPEIDLAVTEAKTTLTQAQAGQRMRVEYSVVNQAENLVAFAFRDAVYLSSDAQFNPASDIRLGTSSQRSSLPGNAGYENFIWATLPNGVSGEFFLLLVTDYQQKNADSNPNNNLLAVNITIEGQGNNGREEPVEIYAPPPPDLVITSLEAPPEGLAGQPIEISYTVSNQGDSTTIPSSWQESVYLAADAQGRTGRILLGNKRNKMGLSVAKSYTDTLTFNLPIDIQGNYFLIIETDAGNRIFEDLMEDNNRVATSFNVIRPPVSDLLVQNITVPDSAYAGEILQVKWVTINKGENPATGNMQEAVYLSADTLLDGDDIRLGIRAQRLNLAPMAVHTDSLTGLIGSLKEGGYYVLVDTDVKNNIYESEETNNLTYSALPIHIKVEKLPLETTVSDSLLHQIEKYFKMEIPPVLHGESITLQLRSEAQETFNEVYIRYGEAASRTTFDFAHTDPFLSNQDVVIPELDSGTYYITLYANSKTPIDQSITLFADILEFEIRDINAEQGGNAGQVTVKIEGAKFEPGIIASLEQDGQSINANSIFRVNPTVIFATFNLDGATLGQYDVVLENTDGDTITKENSFEVEEGSAGVMVATGGQSADGTHNICCVFVEGEDNVLLLDIDHPESTRPNRILNMTIEFTNTGNIDLPVPNRMLVSMSGAPIAFASAELEKGLTELFLDFDEKDGPPKIFRPGATKKFIIYTKSTAEMRFRLIE